MYYCERDFELTDIINIIRLKDWSLSLIKQEDAMNEYNNFAQVIKC